ncbi:MFS transporter [Azospirillum brasilense]|nr:MFS transporter [Azospirillum brasilense]
MQTDTIPSSTAVEIERRACRAAPSHAAGWSAVFALMLCVGTLIASEFMPVSLLTPIASDLRLTEGQAGQAIAVSGIFAVLTSLFISSATQAIDRRVLLLGLTVVMLVSGLVIASAPNFTVMVVGRALVGVVIGGFWSMSAAIVMRLVSEDEVQRALGLLNGGNALATTIATPLGSFLGQYIAWRGAFFTIVPPAALTFLWLFMTLPSMPARGRSGAAAAFRVLRRRNVPLGIMAVSLLFIGQFALFTYLRPFLETVTGVSVTALSLILLALGLSGLLGTYLIGFVVKTRLYGLLVAMPLALAAIALALIAVGSSIVATGVLLALWGFIATAAPVGWWTWLSRTLPDDAEAGGGLMVAAIQLAITLGASAGGLMFDSSGYQATFAVSTTVLCGSAVVAFIASRRAAAAGRSEAWRGTQETA